MKENLDTIMFFAAGLGTRLSTITQHTPKPLVEIKGKPILYYGLEKAVKHGFKHIIINNHYMPDKISAAVKGFQDITPNCPKITLLYEEQILETGGGLKNALPYINRDFIFTQNSDVIVESDDDFFELMIKKIDKNNMDFLILIHKTEDAVGYTGIGDFEMAKTGQLHLRPEGYSKYNFMNAGVQLIRTSIIEQNPKEIFSLSEYYKNHAYKIYGIENHGNWYHLSTVEDLESINRKL